MDTASGINGQQQLPQPERTGGNYRAYDVSHLKRLSFIRRARDLAFSLDQVRELLTLADDRSPVLRCD
jgi:DNA-binding transcriptional MerR regulator